MAPYNFQIRRLVEKSKVGEVQCVDVYKARCIHFNLWFHELRHRSLLFDIIYVINLFRKLFHLFYMRKRLFVRDAMMMIPSFRFQWKYSSTHAPTNQFMNQPSHNHVRDS